MHDGVRGESDEQESGIADSAGISKLVADSAGNRAKLVSADMGVPEGLLMWLPFSPLLRMWCTPPFGCEMMSRALVEA